MNVHLMGTTWVGRSNTNLSGETSARETLQHAQSSKWAKKPRVLERGSSGKADDWRKRWIHWQDLVRMYSSLQYKGGPERDSLFWTRSDISNNLVILQDVLDLELHPQLWQELTTKNIGLVMNSQFPQTFNVECTTTWNFLLNGLSWYRLQNDNFESTIVLFSPRLQPRIQSLFQLLQSDVREDQPLTGQDENMPPENSWHFSSTPCLLAPCLHLKFNRF